LLTALARQGLAVSAVAPVATYDPAAQGALVSTGVTLEQIVVGARTVLGEAGRALRSAVTGQPYAFFHRHHWQQVQAAVDRALAQRAVDVLYLDHLDSFTYASHATDVARVLDMHNVYSTLLSRSAAEARNPLRRAGLALEAGRVNRVERRAVSEVDVTFAVSEADAGTFCGMGARRVVAVPNGVDTATYAGLPTGRNDSAAPVLLFVGSLSWPPNVEACARLVQQVLPTVRQRFPRAEAHLVGRSPSAAVRAFGQAPGVTVYADVPDVLPHLARASTLVVPLTVGGGTRLKILEAFAAGLPVVSTAVGAEGIACRDGHDLLITGVQALADGVVRLLETPGLGLALATEARRLAATTYEWSIVGGRAAEALADAVQTRPSRT
jgi:glycosyltransferase involved in cell wall biosynthesis